MHALPLISIVVPVYNEEPNILPFHDRVSTIAAGLGDRFRFEFVFTDNHSVDRTFALLTEIAARDPRVRAFRFSRNFGFQRSILTGYMQCRGDAAVQLDVDLQDPPELIEKFLETWQSGADVVYGVRIQRQEGRGITAARAAFYRLIDLLSEEELPVDAGDFRLISRRVIDLLCSYRDATPYLRGTIATLGFRQVGVPYTRAARERGESKFPFSKLLSLALDGILNHSTVPLRIGTWFGLSVSVLTLVMMVGYAIGKVVFPRTGRPASPPSPPSSLSASASTPPCSASSVNTSAACTARAAPAPFPSSKPPSTTFPLPPPSPTAERQTPPKTCPSPQKPTGR